MAKTIIYNSATAGTVFDTDHIAVDESTGIRYVNDRDSSTIYKIASNGSITTLLTGYQWNRLFFSGGYLYASIDLGGVYKIDPTNGFTIVGTTIAGLGGYNRGSAANQLDFPYGVAIDSSGNILVADQGNFRIQKFTPSSTSGSNGVTVVGGNGSGTNANQIGYVYDILLDSSDNIYLADDATDSIKKFNAGSTTGTSIAGGSTGSGAHQLNNPRAIAFDSSGNLYVADQGNHRIQKFSAGSAMGDNAVTVAGGNGSGAAANQFWNPSGVAIDSSGNIYVSDFQNHRVQKFPSNSTSATNGTTVAGITGSTGGSLNSMNKLFGPNQIILDSSDNLIVANYHASRIVRFSAGSVSGDYGVYMHVNNFANGVLDIALDSSGNLYYVDRSDHLLRKSTYTSQTTLTRITQTINSNGSATNQLGYPEGFHIFNNDESYVVDRAQGRIMYWTSLGSAGTQIASGLSSPIDVTVDSSGNLIVCDTANHRVLKYTKTATNTFNQTFAVIAGGNGAGSALNQLSSPTAVKSNSDGSVTVLDNGNGRVVKWASGVSQGAVLTTAFTTPSDLYGYANGNLLISDVGPDTVTLVTPETTAPTMTVSFEAPDGSTNSTATLAAYFTSSLPTNDFTIGDVTVSGGTLSNFSTSVSPANSYEAIFTPTGAGYKSMNVLADKYIDSAWGVSNLASNTAYFTQIVAPVVSNAVLSTNNTSVTRAKLGDTVSVSFQTDININSPTVTFTSGGASVTNATTVTGSTTSWTASYVVHASDTDGAVAFVISATSTAGSTASPYSTVSSGAVTIDKVAPVFSSVSPSSSSFISNSNVGYSLSEALNSGTVTFTRTGGSASSNFPVALTGAELNAGTRSLSALTNAPALINGAIYSIAFNGFDLAGNAASTVTVTGITCSITSPTILSVTSTTVDGYYKAGQSVNITVNFSEAVTLSGGDLIVTLETGATDRAVTISSISNSNTASGTYVVQAGDTSNDLAVISVALSAGTIINAASNAMSSFAVGSNLSTTSAIVIDTTAPVISATNPVSGVITTAKVSYTLSEICASGTVTFTRVSGTADGNSPRVINLVSSELTSGVHAFQSLFNGPTLIEGTTYDIAFNATDLAGNNAVTVTNSGLIYSTDDSAPTIVISSPNVYHGGLSNDSSILLLFTLNEHSIDFVVGDVTLSGGTLSGFTGSGKSYAATFTPSGDGSKSISVAAGAFTDGTNNNLASNVFTYTFDQTAPTMTITSSQVANNGSYNGATIELTFTSSEATVNFNTIDITVTNGILSNFIAVSALAYTANFTSIINGLCTISVYSNAYTDLAGNGNQNAMFSWTKTGVAPTMNITSTTVDGSECTTEKIVDFTFTSSTPTTDFVVTDIQSTGGTLSGFTSINSTTYSALFTATTTGGKLIKVPAGSWTNSSGIGNVGVNFPFFICTDVTTTIGSDQIINFVKRGVLKATITTENDQSSSLTDLNFYYENGVVSADVLPHGNEHDGTPMIGTIIDIELELIDNEIPDVLESVIIGEWRSVGH